MGTSAQAALQAALDRIAALEAAQAALQPDTAEQVVAVVEPKAPRTVTIRLEDGSEMTGVAVNKVAERRAQRLASGQAVACEIVLDGKRCSGTMNPARTTVGTIGANKGKRACGKHFGFGSVKV